MHSSPDVALLPEARPIYADLVARGLDHRWAMHHRSSQAFALNLFAPLDAERVGAVFGLLELDAASVAPIEYEYSDQLDRLGESRPKSPHLTQVDVVLRGTSPAGERLIALIEVKFTETDFGHCSAYVNPSNPRLDVCRSPGLFGGQPDHCFQLANHGDGHRAYFEYLPAIPTVQPSGASGAGGCLVRQSLNQPMRNLALAHLLLDTDEADRVVYALCAPENHPTIWRRFGELCSAFPDTKQRTIRPVTAEQIASLHTDGGAAIATRYRARGLGWMSPPVS
jgi:hypothetical protein